MLGRILVSVYLSLAAFFDMFKSKTKKSAKANYLPLNLQFFAEDGESGGTDDGGQDETGNGDDNSEDPSNQDNDGQSGQDGDKQDDSKKKSKTFTQDDVNAIAAREAKKAQEKLLKQLGVKDVKSAKQGLAKLQEILDAQKTDAEKALEKAQTLEETNTQLMTEKQKLEAQVAALKVDVDPTSLEDVIALANNYTDDDTDIEEAMKKVIEKYPHFKRKSSTSNDDDTKKKKPKFSSGEHKKDDKQSDKDAWSAAFNFFGNSENN